MIEERAILYTRVPLRDAPDPWWRARRQAAATAAQLLVRPHWSLASIAIWVCFALWGVVGITGSGPRLLGAGGLAATAVMTLIFVLGGAISDVWRPGRKILIEGRSSRGYAALTARPHQTPRWARQPGWLVEGLWTTRWGSGVGMSTARWAITALEGPAPVYAVAANRHLARRYERTLGATRLSGRRSLRVPMVFRAVGALTEKVPSVQGESGLSRS